MQDVIPESRLGAEQWLTQTDGPDFYNNNTKARGEEWVFFFVGWNIADPLFEDVRVRRAMAHAMDYEEMLEDLCFGLYQRCYGPFSKGSWMYPEKPAPLYEFDLDKAEDLLDDRTEALAAPIERARRAPEIIAKVREDAVRLRARTWRLYLTCSAVAFESGSIGLYQVLMRKHGDPTGGTAPRTRERLYPPGLP